MYNFTCNCEVYPLIFLKTTVYKYSSEAYVLTLTVFEVWTNPNVWVVNSSPKPCIIIFCPYFYF